MQRSVSTRCAAVGASMVIGETGRATYPVGRQDLVAFVEPNAATAVTQIGAR